MSVYIITLVQLAVLVRDELDAATNLTAVNSAIAAECREGGRLGKLYTEHTDSLTGTGAGVVSTVLCFSGDLTVKLSRVAGLAGPGKTHILLEADRGPGWFYSAVTRCCTLLFSTKVL